MIEIHIGVEGTVEREAEDAIIEIGETIAVVDATATEVAAVIAVIGGEGATNAMEETNVETLIVSDILEIVGTTAAERQIVTPHRKGDKALHEQMLAEKTTARKQMFLIG